MLRLVARRFVVVTAVACSLVLAVATVRAAAAWTAAAAPLSIAPTSAETLAARLADGESRSTELRRQLDALRVESGDLNAALEAARARIAADAATAAALRDRLVQAKTRLAALEASLARARAAALAAARAPAPSTGGPTIGGDDHESEADSDG